MLYSYVKATDANPSPGKVIPRYLKVMPTTVSALGLALVASVAWPVGSYQLSQIFTGGEDNPGLLNPIIYESFASDDTSGSTPTVIADIDYTKASNWFTFTPLEENSQLGQSGFVDLTETQTTDPVPTQIPPTPTPAATANDYVLAIPSLGIKEAVVKADTDDLTKSLIQYRNTSFPGERGAPVIFGHSTLPQFFNPTNYLSIFSTLPNLKVGADIFVDYAGVKYTYRVKKKYEVKPNEIWVLRQDFSEKTLKLITCVPPGTKLRRLVVEAELIKT